MTRFRRKRYPVFVVVDDGGFPYVNANNPDNPGDTITFDAYTNILKLAKEFKIRIPICFTMQYLDIHNVSGCAQPLSYATELVDLIKNNQEYMEVGYHGLTHQYKHHIGEFYLLDIHAPVPEEIQREHIYKSYLIFRDLGLDFPKLFVPPYHGWEPRVTDRILAEYGVRYLVSHLHLRFKGQTYKWSNSRYLTLLPREDMGIWNYDINLPIDKLDEVKRWLVPRSLINIFLLSRRFVNKAVHSYMAHIGNFMNPNYAFWQAVFQYAEQDTGYELMKSNEDVVNKYFI